MYYVDHFNMGLKEVGWFNRFGIFGSFALFARALGGIISIKLLFQKV